MKARHKSKYLLLLVILLFLPISAWCQTKSKELHIRAGGGASLLAVIQNGDSGPSFNIGAEWVNQLSKNGRLTFGAFISGVKGDFNHDDDPSLSQKKVAGMITFPLKYKFLIGEYAYLDGGAYLDIGPGIVIGPGVGLGFDFPIVKKLYVGIYGNARLGIGIGAMLNTNAIATLSYRFSLQ
ncbi:MAG: hypothetical protein LBN06_11405 [Prevotellaceae bacterium]|jgi:hypothetical protein|nr:hypothetical protein [Prevotellaceae bacterium]